MTARTRTLTPRPTAPTRSPPYRASSKRSNKTATASPPYPSLWPSTGPARNHEIVGVPLLQAGTGERQDQDPIPRGCKHRFGLPYPRHGIGWYLRLARTACNRPTVELNLPGPLYRTQIPREIVHDEHRKRELPAFRVARVRISRAHQDRPHRMRECPVSRLRPAPPVDNGPGDGRRRVVEHEGEGSSWRPVLAAPEQLRRVLEHLRLIGLRVGNVRHPVPIPGNVALHPSELQAVVFREGLPIRGLLFGPDLSQARGVG